MRLVDGAYARTPVDRTEVPQRRLDIAEKTRANPLSWTGQFSPQLVEALLVEYGGRRSRVLDPFAGSGTVLLESARRHLPAVAAEINPAAYTLSKLYRYANISTARRRDLIRQVSASLADAFPHKDGLFRATFSQQQPTAGETLHHVRQQLGSPARGLLDGTIILADVSSDNVKLPRILQAWSRVRQVVESLPHSEQALEVHLADARSLPLDPESIDLGLTSPPYINVFNYHQKYRGAVEFLSCDVLVTAQSEIGANRKHRGNRFLTVVQYALDIALTLRELNRVVKPTGRLIIVVGRESTVRKTAFFNGELVTEVAARAFNRGPILRQERVFANRYGNDIFEDILHFEPTNDRTDTASVLQAARDVARDVLNATIDHTPEAEQSGLHAAIAAIPSVQPSPGLQAHEVVPSDFLS